MRFRPILQGSGHKCPCTAANLQQLVGFKINAVLKDKPATAVFSARAFRASRFETRLSDSVLQLQHQRAPPA